MHRTVIQACEMIIMESPVPFISSPAMMPHRVRGRSGIFLPGQTIQDGGEMGSALEKRLLTGDLSD
jgi:hypothetical protein